MEPITFSAYDLEWYPRTQQFRMAGVFDGKDYRCYPSMSHFLSEELVPSNFGRIFFAHNGGKSDMQFVLNELLATGMCSRDGVFEMDCSFNGSSAFLCHLRMRDNPKLGFTFADTLFLLKASLKKIGKMIGFEKMDLDSFETENWNELKDYNERDCRVLYKAVKDLEQELFGMGGDLRLTLASTAMALFQTAYLKEPLPTVQDVNDISRASYYASRVEVFTRVCERGLYFDVNSSFPWSMMQSLPGQYLGRRPHGVPPPKGAKRYIAEATVEVKDCYLPPLPFRDGDERILFPTGKWRGVFTDVDLRLLEQGTEGHRILMVHWVDWFGEFLDLGDYVRDIYAKKEKAEGFKREVYKLLLNALYGKFAESETKQKLAIFPLDLSCPHKPEHKGSSCWQPLNIPGLYTIEDRKNLQHVHVPVSAFVTAYSRGLLYRCLSRCKRLYYTDSISGGRTVVTKSPEGRVTIIPVEELWEKVRGRNVDVGGVKEFVSPVGWSALAMDENGVEGWFPLSRIIRHKVEKDLWLVWNKLGQTEVTQDHGIMMSPREPATPEQFVEAGADFVKVKAPVSSRLGETVDIMEFVREFRDQGYNESADFRFEEGEDYVRLVGWATQPRVEVKFRRYYEAGSSEMKALLRLVGAYISEGSASLPSTGCRFLFSIAQNRKEWLQELQRDLEVVAPSSGATIYETSQGIEQGQPGSGMFALRSGATQLPCFFAALCGQRSDGKRLPGFVYDLFRDDALVLWKKLVEGDGSEVGKAQRERYEKRLESQGGFKRETLPRTNRKPPTQVYYTTKSQRLAAGLSFLLSQLGLEHAIEYRADKECWSLRTRTVGSARNRKTTHVLKRTADDWVYDLSVEGARTFVDGIGRVLLHNTDSIVCGEHDVFPKSLSPKDVVGFVGKDVGQLKLEQIIHKGHFAAPKLYMLDTMEPKLNPDGTPKAGFESGDDWWDPRLGETKVVVKSKGFSKLDGWQYTQLIAGEAVTLHRMRGIKENIRIQNTTPREIVVAKYARFKRTKRANDGDQGETRPWTITELMNPSSE